MAHTPVRLRSEGPGKCDKSADRVDAASCNDRACRNTQAEDECQGARSWNGDEVVTLPQKLAGERGSTDRAFSGWPARSSDWTPAFIVCTGSTDKAIKNKTSSEMPYAGHNLHQSVHLH